jgi:hypothetical protein
MAERDLFDRLPDREPHLNSVSSDRLCSAATLAEGLPAMTRRASVAVPASRGVFAGREAQWSDATALGWTRTRGRQHVARVELHLCVSPQGAPSEPDSRLR